MDAPLTQYDRVFLDACKNGRPIKRVLSMGAHMYAVDPKNGFTGLHYACQGGHIEIVKYFLQQKNSSDHYARLVISQDMQGRLPYQYASEKGYKEIVGLIANYGLENLIITDDISYEKFTVYAEDCIKHGADVNAHYGWRYFTPLLTMCAYYTAGEMEKIRFLLDKGADINLSVENKVPIFIALANSGNISDAERLKLMKFFIDRGADVNARGKNRCSLMHQAIMLNDIALVKFLIQKEISLGSLDNFGQNEVHYAVMNQNEEIVQLLLDLNIPMVSAGGEEGMFPLHTAVLKPNLNVINIVLKKMKELNIDIDTLLDHEGQSPLHYAAKYASAEIVQLLLDAGATQLCDNKGRMPLEYALNNRIGTGCWSLLAMNCAEYAKKKIDKGDCHLDSDKKNIEKPAENSKKKKKKKKDKKKKEVYITQASVEEKSLVVSCTDQPVVLQPVCDALSVHIDSDKTAKKSPVTLSKTLTYAAAVIGKGLSLAAQKMDFWDGANRKTTFHIPAGLKPRDISFLDTYKKSNHVIGKANQESDVFHATISDEQIRLTLKYGMLFDTRNEGRVQCYRMLTTKEAQSVTYSGQTEVSIDTKKNKIVHAFFNKKITQ